MFPTQHPVQDLDLGLDLDLIPVPDLEDVLPVAPMSIVTGILTTSAAATMALLNAVDIVKVCGNECIYSGICLIRSPPGHTDHITEVAVTVMAHSATWYMECTQVAAIEQHELYGAYRVGGVVEWPQHIKRRCQWPLYRTQNVCV